MPVYDVDKLISETRRIAAEYRRATGKSLAVSGEIAKHDACVLLGLEPVEAVSAGGYDAVGTRFDWQDKKIQIKGRAIFDEGKSGQRIGQLKLDKDWDAVALVLMDEDFKPMEVHLVSRTVLEQELKNETGNRKNRGAMSVAKFKHLARLVWTESEGVIDSDIWDNKS